MRRVFNGRKHPDPRKCVPLRGGSHERGSRSIQWKARGVSGPSRNSESMTMGCSSSFEGGEPSFVPSCGVRMRGEGGSFAPGCSAHATHRHRFTPSSAQPLAGVVTSPASGGTKNGGLHAFTFRRACSTGRSMWMGSTWLAAAHLKTVSYGTPYCLERGSTGSKGKRAGEWLQEGTSRSCGRGSDARRLCSRVVVVSCRSR